MYVLYLSGDDGSTKAGTKTVLPINVELTLSYKHNATSLNLNYFKSHFFSSGDGNPAAK